MNHVPPESSSTNQFALIVIIAANQGVAVSRRLIDIATQQIDKSVAVANGHTNERLSNSVPIAAPKNISRTARIRRRHRGLAPPANLESAARPVMVKVRTVVVSAGS